MSMPEKREKGERIATSGRKRRLNGGKQAMNGGAF
jgi:hypothetical protein